MEVKTVELALDYMNDMTRYQLLLPTTTGTALNERHELVREVLSMWRKILYATKKEQMQVDDPGRWPTEDFLPWAVTDLDSMPVVVWIKRQPGGGGTR